MKYKFKGFTLVELIVVMALISIIMVGVMRLFTPIRTVYVDAFQYEAQRNSQNGVVKYITESVRFAADMGIYNDGITSASEAVDAFATAYCTANAIDSSKEDAVKAAIKTHAEVIIIANDNNNAHTYRGKTYTGRLIRRKNVGTATSIPSDPSLTTAAYTDDWRIAMGEAYYGENSFSINLTVKDGDSSVSPAVPADGTADDGMLNVTVSSSRNGKRDITNAGKDTTTVTPNVNRGAVLCRNLVNGGNGVNSAGIFDVSKYATPSTGSSTTAGKKTYIVFLNVGGEKVDTTTTPSTHTVYGKKAVLEAAK